MRGHPPAAWLRLCAIAGVGLALAPIQALALARGWTIAATMPVLFHRAGLRIIGARLRVFGSPPAEGPALIVANHVSWLDIPAIGALLPVSFVARADMRAWPVFGRLARWQRTLFLDRERRLAVADAGDMLAARLTGGETIVLFAEGTTGDGNRVLPLRTALLGAAGRARAPEGGAVPVHTLTIVYRARHGLPIGRSQKPEIAWYGDMTLPPHFMHVLGAGPIDIDVAWGPARMAGPGEDRKRLAARLGADMREHFAALSAGLAPDGAGAVFKPRGSA